MAASKDDIDLSRMSAILEKEEFVSKTESSEKRRELEEQSRELFQINLSKARIDKKRLELTSKKADPSDHELLMKKMEEWLALSELEQKNEAIARKWEDILFRWEGIVRSYEQFVGTPQEPITYHDIVKHNNVLKKVALPMLHAYRKVASPVIVPPEQDARARRKSSGTI